MSKKIKITPNYTCREDVQDLWGVKFVKNEDGVHVGEVDAELAAEMIANERATEYKAEPKEIETLVGSGSFAATFTLEDDTELSLGDVVRTAFEAYGKTVKGWNNLKQEKRDDYIKAVVDALPLKKEEAKTE